MTLDTLAPVDLANPVNCQHPLNRGRVAWWLTLPGLDGGRQFFDLVGLNHGVLTNGPMWRGTTRPGGYGSLLFEPSLSVVPIAVPAITADFTVAGWVLSYNMTGGIGTQTWFGVGSTVGPYAAYLSIGAGYAAYYDNAAGSWLEGTSISIPANRWVRVVCLKRGATREIYVNGALAISASDTSAQAWGTGTNIARRVDSGPSFDGLLDDISVWSRGISPAEVRADYDLSRAGYPDVLNRLPLALFAPEESIDDPPPLDPPASSGTIPAVGPWPDATLPLYTPAPVNRAVPLNRGLVSWWLDVPPLDGGQTLYDLAGLNHGTLTNGPTWASSARPGGAGQILFDGADDYIDCGSSPTLQIGGPITIAASVYFTGIPGLQRIVSNLTGSAYSGYELLVHNVTVPNGAAYLQVGNSGTLLNLFDSDALPLNQWVRLVATYDGSTAVIYRDGIQRATDSFGADAIGVSSAPLNIGRWPGGASNSWQGGLDDIRIWNRALSPAEIAEEFALSNAGNPGLLNRFGPIALASGAVSEDFDFAGTTDASTFAAALTVAAPASSALTLAATADASSLASSLTWAAPVSSAVTLSGTADAASLDSSLVNTAPGACALSWGATAGSASLVAALTASAVASSSLALTASASNATLAASLTLGSSSSTSLALAATAQNAAIAVVFGGLSASAPNFEDSFGSVTVYGIATPLYRTTNLDGTPGTGRWISANGNFFGSSAGRIYGQGGVTSFVYADFAPVSTEYDVRVKFFIAGIPADPNRFAFLLSHADGTAGVNNQYIFGLFGNGSGGVRVGGAGYITGTIATHMSPQYDVPGATIGLTYTATITARKSGANLIVAFYLTRANGDSLVVSGGAAAWQATPAPYDSWTDTAPLAKGYAGFRWQDVSGDTSGIHYDDFKITNQDGLATILNVTGPLSGYKDIPSAPFTFAPDGHYTGTLPLGVDWYPSSLSWTNSDVPQTATYSAPLLGTNTLTFTPTALSVSPGSVSYSATIGVHLDSVVVGPSGDIIFAKYADPSGNLTPVRACPVGACSIQINGGPPITLVDAMVQVQEYFSDGLQFCLSPTVAIFIAHSTGNETFCSVYGSAAFSSTGSWSVLSNATNPNFPAGHYIAWGANGGDISVATDHAATALFTFSGLPAGPYTIMAPYDQHRDPINTAAARHIIKDGATTLATVDIDQSSATPLPCDSSLYKLRTVVIATIIKVSDASVDLTVTLSNAGAAGTQLVTDFMGVVTAHAHSPRPAITAGDTVTFSHAANLIQTDAGYAASSAATVATHLTDADLMPFDPSAPRWMKAGYNCDPPGLVSFWHADRFKDDHAWEISAGTPTLDAGGHVTAMSPGDVVRILSFINAPGSASDTRGIETTPPSPFTLRFRYDDPGHDGDLRLGDQSNTGVTFTQLTSTVASGKRTSFYRVTWPPFEPHSTATHPNTGVRTHVVSLEMHECLLNIECFDSDVPLDWTEDIHPWMKDRFYGHNPGPMRFLDATEFSASIVDIEDYGRDDHFGSAVPMPIITANVIRLEPMTEADHDIYPGMVGHGAWRVILDAPFPIKRDQRPSYILAPDNTIAPSIGYYSDTFVNGVRGYLVHKPELAACAWPIDDTTLLMQMGFDCSAPGNADYGKNVRCATLQATHDVTGQGLSLRFQIEGRATARECIRQAEARDAPCWLNVPKAVSDAGSLALANMALAETPAGRKFFPEWDNENWNVIAGASYYYVIILWHRMQAAHALDSSLPDPTNEMEAYAAHSLKHRKIWKDAFIAAGRGDDLMWCLGAQTGDSGYTTGNYLNYCFRHPEMGIPEVLAIENYEGVRFNQLGVGGATDTYGPRGGPAQDRMTRDAQIDSFALSVLGPGRKTLVDTHLSALDNPAYIRDGLPYFRDMKLASYEGGFSTVFSSNTWDQVAFSQGTYYHPRMYRLQLAWLQKIQGLGTAAHPYIATCKYSADYIRAIGAASNWCSFVKPYGPMGTGDPAENPNMWDWDTLVPQVDAGTRAWNLGATVPLPAIVFRATAPATFAASLTATNTGASPCLWGANAASATLAATLTASGPVPGSMSLAATAQNSTFTASLNVATASGAAYSLAATAQNSTLAASLTFVAQGTIPFVFRANTTAVGSFLVRSSVPIRLTASTAAATLAAVFGVVNPDLGPVALTLFQAIRDRLKAEPGLADLTEIYKNQPQRGWTYPFMVISAVHADSEITNTPHYWENEEFQFAVMSDDDLQAEALGKLARKSLMPQNAPKLLFADGYEMARYPSFHGRLIEQPNSRTVGNVNAWMYVFGYNMMIGRVQ